jgi:hypothetical protein
MAFGVSKRLVVLVSALLLTAPIVFAQSQATTGVIEGRVTDESDAVLPGATVVLTNVETNQERTLVADESGRYRGVLLPLGLYRVAASLQGFASQIKEGIELGVGQTLTINFVLAPGAFEDEIIVQAETPLVQTSRTDNAVTVDEEAMFGLPNNGRNFVQFMNLTPGVGIVQGPDAEEITVNGQKGIQNNVMVDGADFNNPFFGEQRGGQRPAFTFNIDAVQEMVVVADGAPAEFGRASAGFVTVVTKSGTNDFRGTAHLFYQDDSLKSEAKRQDGSTEPKFPSERVQGGFTLGGPIIRDKLFFFTALDVQRGESTKQENPDRIEQRVVDALASLGAPNEHGPITRTDDNEVFLAKLDWQPSNDHLATVRYSFTNTEQDNGTFDVDSWGRSANAVEKDSSWSLGGSLVSTIGDNKLNELRLQYAFEDRPRPYTGATFTGTDRPLPDTAFDFDKSYRFGMPFFIPVIYDDTRWQFVDNFTWLTGSHTVKAGVEYNQTEAFQTFVGFGNARFIFGSTDGFLNYIDNPLYLECSDGSSSDVGVCPEGTSATGPVIFYLQQTGLGGLTVEEAGTQTIEQEELALFIQDLWQPSPNLTFSFGLRWESQNQPDLITPRDELFYGPFIGQTVNGQEFPGDGTIPSDTGMFQPRLGVSWDPGGNGRTVLRANAGIYNARVPGLYLASARSTDGSRGGGIYRDSTLIDILGPTPPYDELLDLSGTDVLFNPDVYVFDKDFKNPRTKSFAVSAEHVIFDRMALVLKYNYADTDRLTRYLNLNDPLLGANWSTGLGSDGTNGIGTLWTAEAGGESEYWGLTGGVKGWIGNRINLQAYYTYGEDKSNDDNERDPFTLRYARITDLDAEWGFSDRDQRHRVNLWFLWAAPKGWNLNFSYAYRSAQPLSLTETGEVAESPQDRINADGTVTQRNLGRKDNEFSSLDVRISKLFNLGKGFQIEGIVEAFNVFNSTNEKKPQTTNLIFNFDGTITTGLGDPRQFQVGARFIF